MVWNTTPKVHMGQITGGEARELYAKNPIILLPMGSHEDQGPHAPMGDYLLAEKMYWDAARPVATNPRKQWTAKKVGRKIVAKHTKSKAAFTASRDMVITAPHGFKKDGTPKKKPGGQRK